VCSQYVSCESSWKDLTVRSEMALSTVKRIPLGIDGEMSSVSVTYKRPCKNHIDIGVAALYT
jgi:hypothetical protein